MRTIFTCLLLLILFQNTVAQCNPSGSGLTATANATPATCPLNGTIAVVASSANASGPYTFTLTGSCLTVPIVQSQASPNYAFTALQGNCTYTICISDGGGNIISKTATVANTYSILTGLSIAENMFTNASCSKIIGTVAGGSPPYSYELFNGNIATGVPIQGPQTSNIFFNINASSSYSIRATDACGQSIVTSKSTSTFKPKSISLLDAALESSNSIRAGIFLNNFYGGTSFQDNNIPNATNAGLKLPIQISAIDNTGNLIVGYPYNLQPLNIAGWGQSANTFLDPNLRWSPKIPNTPSKFPITFSYVDACGALASLSIPYNIEFSRAVYANAISNTLDTSTCPIKNCISFNIAGDYVAGTNYIVGLFNNATAIGSPLQSITYPAQNSFCGLNFNTTYYLKTFDPILNKDTIISASTGNPLPAFSVLLNNCFSYCNGLATVGFSYTGLYPKTVIATAGPGTFGPYPKVLNFSSSNGFGTITNLAAGGYSITFTTKCGETSNAIITVNAGSINAQPTVIITPTGCASASVKILPNVSTTGQMLAYHNTPGCHPLGAVSYYANIIFSQISGGASLPGSNNIIVDNTNTGYSLNVNTPGTYVAIIAYSQGIPGLNNAVSACYQTVRDTFTVAFNTIPTIVRVYTLPCAAGSYSIVPIAPNAVAGTTYTLYAANGSTVLAPAQTSNTFTNISVSAGTNLVIKSLDPCGQSSIVPFTITTSTSITGGIDCLPIGTNSSADSLHADFINGGIYTWTAPNGNTYNGNNPPLIIPSQAGVWTLSTLIQSGPCTATLTNSFTTSTCNFVPPINDTIKLSANTNNCSTTLNWSTDIEQNTLRFDVEESTDNINWHWVGTKAAAGNSSSLQQYSITLTTGVVSIFYRIKLVKINGQFKYSNTVIANTFCFSTGGGGNDILTFDNNTGTLILSSSVGRGNAVLIFIDAIGRQYLRKPISIISGINYYNFKAPQYLAKGAYFVRLIALDGSWRSNTLKILWLKN